MRLDILALLSSQKPSERARATRWLLEHADPDYDQEIVRAIEAETVPALLKQLGLIRAASTERRRSPTIESETGSTAGPSAPHTDRADLTPPPQAREANPSYAANAAVLDGLSALLRHETEPVIGWLRRSAAEDIGPGFENSETFSNIELLRHRIRGLETLAAAHQSVRPHRESLNSLVRSCQPEGFRGSFSDQITDDVIETDKGLFTLIVSNALLNALEASGDVENGDVRVQTGVSNAAFWIAITNHFRGESFQLEQLIDPGLSSKQSHQGLGLGAMQLAAERLGCKIDLRADGGIAYFTLRGARGVA